jgi:hypothetical protein
VHVWISASILVRSRNFPSGTSRKRPAKDVFSQPLAVAASQYGFLVFELALDDITSTSATVSANSLNIPDSAIVEIVRMFAEVRFLDVPR